MMSAAHVSDVGAGAFMGWHGGGRVGWGGVGGVDGAGWGGVWCAGGGTEHGRCGLGKVRVGGGVRDVGGSQRGC